MHMRNLRDFLLYGPFRAAFAGDPSRHYYYERRRCRPSCEDDPRDYNRGHWRHWQRWRGWEDHPWSGMPGGPRARFFESGEVRLAILSLLKDAPKHGYQLIKELTERSGGLYKASAGTVYPTLQQLEDEGLVVSEAQEGRKVYRLTPDGAQELEREKETVDRIWARADSWGDWGQWMGPEAFTFLRPLGALIKATFKAARWADGDHEREGKVAAILERTKEELKSLYKSGPE